MHSLLFVLAVSGAAPLIEFEADTSDYAAATQTFRLSGDVRLSRLDPDRADSVTLYADAISGRVGGMTEARGNLRVLYGGHTLTATEGYYDFATSTGMLRYAGVEIPPYRVSSEEVRLAGPDHYEMRATDAEICPCHIRVKSGRTTFKDGKLAGYNNRFYYRDVPVFWFPYLPYLPGTEGPPFRLSAGKSDFEGFYAKVSYPYRLAGLGEGFLKTDLRTRRGWAYGLYHEMPLRAGRVYLDLYRIEERDRGGRGIARGRIIRDFMKEEAELRLLGDVYYLTDRNFLRQYRFEDEVREPDPESFGSLSYRRDDKAFMLRTVFNLNQGDYEVFERLPELRAIFLPRRFKGGFLLDAEGSVGAFRHYNPYDDSVRIRLDRAFRERSGVVAYSRGHLGVEVKRPYPIGAGIVATPYLKHVALAYTEANRNSDWSPRNLPEGGVIVSRMLGFRLSDAFRWRVRPQLQYAKRAEYGTPVGTAPIVEELDQRGKAHLLRLVLDQGLYKRSSAGLDERIRLRLDGGLDMDRPTSDRYLPITAKITALFRGGEINGDVEIDPNRIGVMRALAELRYATGRLSFSGGYYRRFDETGLVDIETVSGDISGRLSSRWSAQFSTSYNLDGRRIQNANYALTYHDDCVDFAVRVIDRRDGTEPDLNVSVDLKLP